MSDLSSPFLHSLDELTDKLARQQPIPEELLNRLRSLWLAERPGDEAGLAMFLRTIALTRSSDTVREDCEESLAAPGETESVPVDAATERAAGWWYPVFFATNRQHLTLQDGTAVFQARRAPTTIKGRCDVWLPRARRFGDLGSPWWKRWLRGEFADDRARLGRTLVLGADDFERELRAAMHATPGKRHGLVFIHGYCTSFETAALRAAQLGFDLQVSGATAFFAWPSQGTLRGYPADGAAIEASEGAIGHFLSEFARDSGADVVHVIAHSMGNRGLLRALQRMASRAEAGSGVRFGQLILAAPDIDRDLFLELSALYARFAQRTTLYASSADRAVHASSWLHGAIRAGYLPPVTVVPPPLQIDTVAVPDLDLDLLGHSYFAGDALLQDMFELVRHGTPPEARQRLRKTQGHWEFRH